jgi:glycosyltransferase involved in cell wall biosynthesis
MQKAPVSVIIPCYCCSETIERTVLSVIHQSLSPAEILLVDDCSNDGGRTLSTLHRLQEAGERNGQIVKVILLAHNSGPGGARNAGWQIARSPLIAFLDADDTWHPRKIEIQCRWMELRPDVVLTAHLSERIGPGGSVPDLPTDVSARRITRTGLLLSNGLPTRSVMLRRGIAFRFEAAKRRAEDYLLWLKIVLTGNPAWRLELPLAYSHKPAFGSGGLSRDLWKMEMGELDTYRRLYQEQMISLLPFAGLGLLSLTKHFRRVLLTYFR